MHFPFPSMKCSWRIGQELCWIAHTYKENYSITLQLKDIFPIVWKPYEVYNHTVTEQLKPVLKSLKKKKSNRKILQAFLVVWRKNKLF